ncbi:MAG: hypothetical protein VX152_12370, partial [Pseudomonadota bacterium]|nr:hypothetical protein [Pseudomonadota bacterium]
MAERAQGHGQRRRREQAAAGTAPPPPDAWSECSRLRLPLRAAPVAEPCEAAWRTRRRRPMLRRLELGAAPKGEAIDYSHLRRCTS